ncbi:MAG: hypothetical protein HDT02_05320 [Bacteroidales bacterium]|nr:hypothetical protein [Bacteroidales bacterium]
MTSDTEAKIRRGEICSFCGLPTEVILHSGWRERKCPSCGASVRCHFGTDRGMGRVAGSSLKRLRKEAHRWFDAVWKNKIKKSRYNAYSWLALRMHKNKDDVHFSLMTEEECRQAIEVCRHIIMKENPDLYRDLSEKS